MSSTAPLRPAELPPCVKLVGSFHELVNTPLRDSINALCWPRELPGDYAEIVHLLQPKRGINPVNDSALATLHLSAAGQLAREQLWQDQRLLREHGLEPSLDTINGYLNQQPASDIMRTDVCSFHVDTATVEAETYLCTYFGASSEGLPNDQAIAKASIPEIRAALLKQYGGADDKGFAEYLEDHFYDLHYAPQPNASTYTFGTGNLWRIAIQHPHLQTLPCIHRAPDPSPGQPPRLLLIC